MPRPVSVTYRVSPTPAATARAGAQLFTDAAVKAAAARGLARIAISGGTTPKTMFGQLADLALAAEQVRYAAAETAAVGIEEPLARGRELLDRLDGSAVARLNAGATG